MCRQALKDVSKCTQDAEYQHYAFSNLTAVNYTSLEGGYEYYFKVRLNKINGYYGSLSEATQFIIVKGKFDLKFEVRKASIRRINPHTTD
jgi:hypothetical protein